MHSTAYLWLKVYRYSQWSSQGCRQDRPYDVIAYAEYAVKYTETLIIPEVEMQYMFSRFLVQLFC